MAGSPLTTGKVRVFLIEGRARYDRAPSYQSQLRLTGPSQSFGDVERIEVPDPDRYDSWIEVDSIKGAIERATATLEGRYARDTLSTMLRIARRRMSMDIQLHFGACDDPRSFNTFDKALIFEDAQPTEWSNADLGALSSGDNAVVDESLSISAKNMYEVAPVTYSSKASSIVTNEVVGAALYAGTSCDVATQFKIFAVTKAAGGSPSTPADIVFSTDGGTTWYAHDVDTAGTTEQPTGIAIIGGYLVVISNTGLAYHYAPLSSFNGVDDPAFTKVTTGFVTAKGPNSIWSTGNFAFIVGDGGYIYKLESLDSGVSVLSAGDITTSKLNAVHAPNRELAVAVGNSSTVLYTVDGVNWSKTTRNPAAPSVNLNAVWAKSKTEWFVGGTNGVLYATTDGGSTWNTISFPGSGSGAIKSIAFSTDSVGWLSHQTSSTVGRILRTYSGGNSWVVTPEKTGSLPDNDSINALAVTSLEPNMVVGVGLAGDGSDGIILLGSGSY